MHESITADVLVPDTSVLVEALLSDKIPKNEPKIKVIIVHEAALAELEHQANEGKAVGFLGINEIKRLNDLSSKHNFQLLFKGQRPRAVEIKHASLGEIDALIRQLAYDEDATLITSDKVQSEVALARGVKVIYFRPQEKVAKKVKLEKFFDETTMSVHLRENVMPYAKKGRPGDWQFVALRKKELDQEELKDISREIIESAKLRHDSFIEIERFGSTIVQMGSYRIVITRPPFSDGWEITAVRPVKKLSLKEYNLSAKLMKRVAEQAEGILVAGAPGMGKSTFAQALAEYYAGTQKIVKTIEAPRDMVLPDNITQYAISHGDAQEIHDILLLSRPDYTIFDEMRNTADFQLFADMRLAGVGLLGVVHGTNPVDSIQRFIGRIEMGVIPQVIDTVLFIKNGQIFKVLSLEMTVKVPSGMTEADLARPVVVINDFESGALLYEIYSYGEQTVVVPVKGDAAQKSIHKLAVTGIEDEFRAYTNQVKVEVINDHKAKVFVPEKDISKIIGKGGKTISDIEKKLGIGIDVESLDSAKEVSLQQPKEQQEIKYDFELKKNNIIFHLDLGMQYKDVDIYLGKDFLLTAKAGQAASIKVKKTNNIGNQIMRAMQKEIEIKLFG